MKVLYNWLKEFVELKAPAADLRPRLSLCGIAIDLLEESPAGPLLDAEITTNRPDCLGHYGIAREAAAIYRLPLKSVQPKLRESAEEGEAAARVEIEAPDLCGRFTARVIRGAKIQPSPDWLRQRLEAIGQASINNVVDITNYVMMELGHPLHAYDLDKLREHRIVVRHARQGEKLRTLDGVERTLVQAMCVIADGARAVGIGGVMGGAETEISFSTRNILVECAWFEPIPVRRASKALNLRTEASYRFERGMDPEMADLASRRTAELIQQLAGGEILAGVIDVYPRRDPSRTIELTRKEILRVMGADIPDRDIEDILGALGFHPVRVDSNRGSAGSLVAAWDCTQPSWRRDVTRGIDLIEEVARHFGYDKFPPHLPPAKQSAHLLPRAEVEERLVERLVALGYQEVVEIPLVDQKRDVLFRAENTKPAVIGNPLAEDASTMRSSGIVNMVSALEWNLNHGQRNLRLFEIGRTYSLNNGAPVETPVLTVGATGLAREKSIYETEREYDFEDLKGDLDRLGELAGGFGWHAGGPSWLVGGRGAKISLAHGHRHETHLGVAGQLARKIADHCKLRQPVFLAELQLEPLLQGIEAARAATHFVPLPRFPAVERDFSLVLPDGITFAQVAETIRGVGIQDLQDVRPIDRMTGEEISGLMDLKNQAALAAVFPAGTYALTVRVTFQSADSTLTDAQISDFSGRISASLSVSLGASLRTS